MGTRQEIVQQIAHVAYRRGSFRLRSGQWSSEYVDKYQFEAHPELLRALGQLIAEQLPPGAEVIAGMELGGVPLAVAASLASGLPCAFVRKEAKEYGTQRRSEGFPVAGRRVVLVEDVVTTGGQLLEGLEVLRQEGAQPILVLCVIDRQQGAAERLRELGVSFRALFTLEELRAAAIPNEARGDSEEC
ncbi:MAG: orotate phosphoribosyltransferase [Candidatus Kapabacteria bacterium]|nr:orotate phosphoribosyltransferase [Candidatus Kapabacteria bacterium]MDW7997715.1 orotate phosphoribosyltransferase [Bacteroidota bacterium]